MGRRKLGIVRMNLGVDPKIMALYTKLGERTGTTASALIREAMVDYARRVLVPQAQALAAQRGEVTAAVEGS